MTRSQVAKQAGVGSETVRFYEQRGLIPDPPRTPSGYRHYDASYVERIQFIQRAQQLGFSLNEIRGLLDLRVDATADAGEVRRRARAKRTEVEAKLRDLERIHAALSELIDACCGHGPTSACPILDALDGKAIEPAAPSPLSS